MTQAAGRRRTSKILFFFLSHHFHDWTTGLCLMFSSPDRVSMVSYATVPAWPILSSPPRVDQVLEFCPPRDRTNNLTVISPTLSPLNQRGDVFSVQVHVYIPQSYPNFKGIEKPESSKNWPCQESNRGHPCHCWHLYRWTIGSYLGSTYMKI